MGEEKREEEGESDTKIEGFHVICGLSPKNGITGAIHGTGWYAGDISKSEGSLDLIGLNSLLIVDLDHFVEHHEEILGIVKGQIEERNKGVKER